MESNVWDYSIIQLRCNKIYVKPITKLTLYHVFPSCIYRQQLCHQMKDGFLWYKVPSTDLQAETGNNI